MSANESGEHTEAMVTPTPKKPYAAPKLRRLGSVRELTLGTSPGQGADGGGTKIKHVG